jgi:two-component system chemotaxis response regulator CheY
MAYTILIVDDSATTRAFIKRTLKLTGIPTDAVLEAGDGKAALDVVAKQQKVDLILADLHMPEMNGVEMTRRLLADERTRSIPVIVVSADPNTDRLEQLTSEGVRGVLRKPFTPEGLKSAVAGILGEPAHA